jgi:hypothetical protein
MLTVGFMVDISMDWWDKLQETTNISWENRWFPADFKPVH